MHFGINFTSVKKVNDPETGELSSYRVVMDGKTSSVPICVGNRPWTTLVQILLSLLWKSYLYAWNPQLLEFSGYFIELNGIAISKTYLPFFNGTNDRSLIISKLLRPIYLSFLTIFSLLDM